MSQPDEVVLAALPAIPRNEDGPVFRAPWEAASFAMVVRLHEKGLFTWSEWAAALGSELAAAGPSDTGEHYYRHWLAALETLLNEKGAIGETERLERQTAWDRAARSTPHGQLIVLGR